MDTKPKTPEAVLQQLANRFVEAAAGQPHHVLLEALLNTFVAVATAHPCCTQACATGAMTASLTLAQHAANTPQHPLH